MNRFQLHIAKIAILSLILLAGCKQEGLKHVPYFSISANKVEGLTTDIFVLTINPESTIPADEKFHGRWDWEGDSVFNTRFTDDMEINHRFYKPGNYHVVCEVLSLSGAKAMDTINIKIEQGYSAPKANFRVLPETGHFKTNFLLDGSLTIDDEDSLETLQFRWDFQGDGLWDTQYSKEPAVYHNFEKVEDFLVKLEVLDPSKRSGSSSQILKVHRTDTCIVPEFTWWSENGRVSDVFVFDASGSYHQNNPEQSFTFKWLFPNQEYTQSLDDPVIEHQFKSPGKKKVVLLVEDDEGLQNTLEKELFVSIENKPPRPKIITPTRYGNIETQFYLNAWGCLDDMTPTSKLLLRWDFDGDGNWDTNQNSELEIYHQYTMPGIYTCILEAEDEEGLTDITSFVFEVSPYDYPTGFFKDKRDNKYYGTVKIGDYWWMSENLDYRLEPKMGLPHVQKCYDDNPVNCDKYGALYAMEFARTFLDFYEDSICPESWHIPTRKEMENLIENIEYPNGMYALLPNGSSGFNALFGGYIIYECILCDTCTLCKYVYHHRDIKFSTYFLTTTWRPNRVPPRIYTLNIQTNYAELYPIETNMTGYYSVRCVKD